MYQKQDYSYILPKDLIAEEAAQPHHNAKLMVIDRSTGNIDQESLFWDLDTIIDQDRVIYFNNSRVLRARVLLENTEYQDSNGTTKNLIDGEIFYLKSINSSEHEVLVRPGSKFKVGNIYSIGEYTVEVTGMTDTGRTIQITKGGSSDNLLSEFLEQHGTLPLPPYIEYSREKEKDYQTAFAKKDGSVAAPTASLHFTEELLTKIKNPKKYVTLHVGLGTFKGLDTDDVRDYTIHRESIEIDIDTIREIAELKRDGKKIVAVGTTACRTLESLPSLWQALTQEQKSIYDKKVSNYWNSLVAGLDANNWIEDIIMDHANNSIKFSTAIYITPGYVFRVVDDLITNFHLPESSLLVLVSAFLGHDHTMDIYKQAIEKKYRFFSFGDGMYIQSKG